MPQPPRLHWGLVLALSLVTLGLFGVVWLFVQAIWVKRVTGRNKAFGWTLAYLLYLPAMLFLGIVGGLVAVATSTPVESITEPLQLFARLAGIILYLFAAFTLKGELEADPVGVPLGGVMTFLFAPVYFQYFLYDYGPDPSIRGGSLNLSRPVAPLAPEVSASVETQTPPKTDQL
jgi:hypothetical protein